MMLNDFLLFIRNQKLCQKNNRVLLAVSGGIDSMVMLDLFHRGGFNFAVAHCNFSLRGADSDADERFVKKKAESTGTVFHTRQFDTGSYSRLHGISIQMAARQLRYEWFEALKTGHGYDRIATAHHLDDQIETLFFNLIRGTGLKGLTGIPVRQGPLIRPLLFAGKDTIIRYAAENKVEYREDRSNRENKYHRNLIRNRILPLFEKINPGYRKTVQSSVERLKETQRLMDSWISDNRERMISKKGVHVYVDRKKILRINSPVFLHEVLQQWGFNYDQCLLVLQQDERESGALFYSDSHVLNVDREYLILSPREKRMDRSYSWPEDQDNIETGFGVFTKSIIKAGHVPETNDPNRECFDLERVKFPLKIRSWKQGDWFIPLGMKGKKKLSDFMIDEKIPVNLKKRIPVLFSEETVIWVVGRRMDERFRIMPDNQKILMISFEPFHDQSF